MAGTLATLTLTDRLACQGMQSVYGLLRADELKSASEVRAVEEQESLQFSYPRLDETGAVRAITAQLRAGRIITATSEDGSVESEWRLGIVIPPSRGGGGLITVECVPLWLDLVERADSSSGKGWVSDISGGLRNFDFEITEQTATQIWATYIIPNCPSWVTAGTINPTYVIPSLSVSRMTPGALAIAVRDALRNVDVSCELQLRRNGSTDYKLDLVTQIGASAATPVFHPHSALLTLKQESNPTQQATRILMRGGAAPDSLPGIWGRARFRGGVPAGTTIALTDRNGGASPIGFDGQFVGNYLLRVKTGATFEITGSSAAAGTVTLVRISDIAADEDFEFRLDEPATNTRTTTTRYAVSSVPDATHIALAVSAPIIANGQYTDWQAQIWSAAIGGVSIARTRITGSVATTDVIAVASSSGVNNTHYVEFVQVEGAGEVPSYVDHPIYTQGDPVGYGVKVAEVSRAMLGVQQLIPNAWMRQYTNPATVPDGWTAIHPGASSRNSNVAFTRYGGYSMHVERVILGVVHGHQEYWTPIFYHATTDGATALSVRTYIYCSTFSGDASVTLEIFALKGDGSLGKLLGSAKIGSPTYTLGDATLASPGTWMELKVGAASGPIRLSTTGDPASVATAPFGLRARVTVDAPTGADDFDVYVDGVEAYAFSDCPSEPFEFGDAPALLQAGNNQLRLVASPPQYYTIGILDLERIMPSEYARLAQTVGANVRAVDPEYGIDATVRLLTRQRNLLEASQTQLTLANRPTQIWNQQKDSADVQRRVIDVVNAGSSAAVAAGPAFVALTADVVLTANAEIATPSGAPVVVTLPAADATAPEETGTSVSYVPPDPTTTPTVVVTAGTPPSRRKPLQIY